MAGTIYKLFRSPEWEKIKQSQVFDGSPDDRRDGFIHLSAAHQVRGTVAKHFAGDRTLIMAALDPDRLGAALKWEVSRGGDTFPHLYGALKMDAVLSVLELHRRADGGFDFPSGIP